MFIRNYLIILVTLQKSEYFRRKKPYHSLSSTWIICPLLQPIPLGGPCFRWSNSVNVVAPVCLWKLCAAINHCVRGCRQHALWLQNREGCTMTSQILRPQAWVIVWNKLFNHYWIQGQVALTQLEERFAYYQQAAAKQPAQCGWCPRLQSHKTQEDGFNPVPRESSPEREAMKDAVHVVNSFSATLFSIPKEAK